MSFTAPTQPTFVAPDAHRYLEGLAFGAETPVMVEVRRRCEEEGLPAVSPTTGQLLRMLAAAACPGGSGRIAEVGCLYGYSSLWMASAGPNVRIHTIEDEDAHADVAEANFRDAGIADRVSVHRGLALDVLPEFEAPFDMVFLDAAKAEYPKYLQHARRLLRPGGIVAADNLLWSGDVWDTSVTDADTEALRQYTAEITTSPDFASTVLPVGDGLGVSVYRP